MGLAVLLLGDGVARLVEHFLDLCQRDLLRVVIDMNGLRPDIDLDLAHTFQLTNSPLDRVLAVLARDVRCYKCRRFHHASPPLLDMCKSSRTSSVPFIPPPLLSQRA